MAYEKQNFSDGQVLTADQLNRMEAGICSAVQSVNGKTPDENGNVQLQIQAEGSGLSDTAKTLLITILSDAVYTTDQSANITALEQALASSGGDSGGGSSGDEEEPDTPADPDAVTCAVSVELVNITSSNDVQSVALGSQYTATLTANDGYLLPSTMGGSVTVTMGGTDITSEVYNYDSGEITITSVTGDIVIKATAFAAPKLIEDGLVSFFDLRAAEFGMVDNYKRIPATKGTGGLMFNNVDKEVTEKGIIFGNDRPTYITGNTVEWVAYPGTNYQYTIIVCYYADGSNGYSTYFPNAVLTQEYPNWDLTMKYIDTSGTTVTKQSDVFSPSATKAGFIAGAISVGADKTIFAIPSGVVTTINASECENFDHFDAYPATAVVNPDRATDAVTFYAVYNRALSTVEMTEVLNYMMTEVAG